MDLKVADKQEEAGDSAQRGFPIVQRPREEAFEGGRHQNCAQSRGADVVDDARPLAHQQQLFMKDEAEGHNQRDGSLADGVQGGRSRV